MVVVCCPDKFRGSLSAREAAEALAAGVRRAGYESVEIPLADGGEGTLDVLCPSSRERRTTRVRGPLGEEVAAEWGLRADGTAVVEMARASGLALVGESRRPLDSTTFGTGQLIRAAIEAGATQIVVGVGGSATVDGGLGALEALDWDLGGTEVVIACDVTTGFVDAAGIFGPQKGAGRRDIVVLEDRLRCLAGRYRDERGIDVQSLAGAGAAGGLAGGLAAIGATLVPGAALIAEVVGLEQELVGAAFVITGEGRLDATSLGGKVVGYVLQRAAATGVAVGIVAGQIDPAVAGAGSATASLVELGGSVERAKAAAALLAADASELVALRLGREAARARGVGSG